MVQFGYRDVSLNVVQGPSLIERLTVGTGATKANMLPGALVCKEHGVNDRDVSENFADDAGPDKPIGWLGYEHANPNYKPDTRDSSYNTGDEVPVHNGGGFRVRALLAAGSGAVVKGDLLDASANSTVKLGAAGTDDILAVASQSLADSESVQRIWAVSRL